MQNENPRKASVINRRDFLSLLSLTAAAAVLPACAPPPPDSLQEPAPEEKSLTQPDANGADSGQLPFPPGYSKGKQALVQLMVGNLRYVEGGMKSPHQEPERRRELTTGQHPIAAVLSCSDSRLPPEVIFDQGLGDIFVVRVAGNTAAFEDVKASLEYAVEHLKVPLVMVLGHQKCGAITAALEGAAPAEAAPAGDDPNVSLDDLILALQPAVISAAHMAGDRLENAIRINVALAQAALRDESEIIAHALKTGSIDMVGAYYSLDTGKVDLI